MLDRSSIVKTLAKKLFSVSALSEGVLALEPSCRVNVGIDCFDFSRDLAYFQNGLGLTLIVLAKFHSKR